MKNQFFSRKFAFLVGLMILLFNCSENSSFMGNAANKGQKKDKESKVDVDKEEASQPEDSELATEATDISGAFLTCDVAYGFPHQEKKVPFGCVLGNPDKTKFLGKTEEWNLSVEGLKYTKDFVPEVTLAQETDPWHILFEIPSIEIATAFVMKASVKAEGQDIGSEIVNPISTQILPGLISGHEMVTDGCKHGELCFNLIYSPLASYYLTLEIHELEGPTAPEKTACQWDKKDTSSIPKTFLMDLNKADYNNFTGKLSIVRKVQPDTTTMNSFRPMSYLLCGFDENSIFNFGKLEKLQPTDTAKPQIQDLLAFNLLPTSEIGYIGVYDQNADVKVSPAPTLSKIEFNLTTPSKSEIVADYKTVKVLQKKGATAPENCETGDILYNQTKDFTASEAILVVSDNLEAYTFYSFRVCVYDAAGNSDSYVRENISSVSRINTVGWDKSCNTYCANKGQKCISVGLDAGATDTQAWYRHCSYSGPWYSQHQEWSGGPYSGHRCDRLTPTDNECGVESYSKCRCQ